jgi:hypothetical protein
MRFACPSSHGGPVQMDRDTSSTQPRATSTDRRSNRCAVHRVQCWTEIAFGPRSSRHQ